jgi:hypothetical protein
MSGDILATRQLDTLFTQNKAIGTAGDIEGTFWTHLMASNHPTYG